MLAYTELLFHLSVPIGNPFATPLIQIIYHYRSNSKYNKLKLIVKLFPMDPVWFIALHKLGLLHWPQFNTDDLSIAILMPLLVCSLVGY